MKQQLVVTHTIRQTEIPALLDGCSENKSSVNIFFYKILILTFS